MKPCNPPRKSPINFTRAQVVALIRLSQAISQSSDFELRPYFLQRLPNRILSNPQSPSLKPVVHKPGSLGVKFTDD